MLCGYYLFFFFNDTATTEIYTLSLHDALPILAGPSDRGGGTWQLRPPSSPPSWPLARPGGSVAMRSEEHTSELQSQSNLVCRLLLGKKKKTSQPLYMIAPHRRCPPIIHYVCCS